MRRLLFLPPIAAVASGCAEGPTVPAPTMPQGWHEAEAVDTVVPAYDDVLRRWQLPADDAWAPYAKYTLFTALDREAGRHEVADVGNLEEVQRATPAALRLASDGLPPDVMWVVDLRGAASVAFGTALSAAAREPVSLVPTFNNWPADNEFVPAEETLAALATLAPRPNTEKPGPSRPVFLLDAWRLAYRTERPGDDVYDNRYALAPTDLPAAQVLAQSGIRRVVYVVESRARVKAEEDDLNAAFVGYRQAGIDIAMVDLADLAGQPAGYEGSWGYADRWIEVNPRVTIFEQPLFFGRSHGGFGGIRAMPHHVVASGVMVGHPAGGHAFGGGHAHGGGG
jgi:hypothetical protein